MVDLARVLDYQKQGIHFLAKRDNVLLADDTGLGKSLQCLLAAEALKYKRLLILCPVIGLVAWREEARKWTLTSRTLQIFTTKKTDPIKDGPLLYLVPYSQLSHDTSREQVLARLRRAAPFDVLIIDEAHYLSNPASKRTVAVYGRFCASKGGVLDHARVKSCWVLSGTIQKRDARDLYPHLKAIWPEAINQALGRPKHASIYKNDYDDAFLTYTDNGFTFVPTGNNAKTIPLLREAMKPFVLARRKRDVALELGTIRRYDLPLGLDPDDPYAKQVEHPEFGKALIEELFSTAGLSSLALTETAAEERRVLGMIKVRPVCAWIEDWFENARDFDKLVVFAWHRDVLRELHERLQAYHPVIVMGGTSDKQRLDAVTEFQKPTSKCRLFLGQTIAAGISVTLTAASTVVMIEPDWIPANDHQAVSRVHRLGQTEPVIVYRAFVSGTVDSRILTRANQRAVEFEQLMDGLVTAPPGEAHAPAS